MIIFEGLSEEDSNWVLSVAKGLDDREAYVSLVEDLKSGKTRREAWDKALTIMLDKMVAI